MPEIAQNFLSVVVTRLLGKIIFYYTLAMLWNSSSFFSLVILLLTRWNIFRVRSCIFLHSWMLNWFCQKYEGTMTRRSPSPRDVPPHNFFREKVFSSKTSLEGISFGEYAELDWGNVGHRRNTPILVNELTGTYFLYPIHSLIFHWKQPLNKLN